ncbi:MAG TPA: two-component regulator propeller domain-containing protein [Puia sp.]|nr:two-component regulator propeller domain-containing protein [Puia sp.]
MSDPCHIVRFLLLVMLQTAAITAGAQQQHIKFQHLGTDQGLSQSNVTCILKDSRGFMWFGTRDGLNKYNGYEFRIYKNIAGEPGSISNNYITDIIEDSRGDLWIATWGGGLNRYDREKDRFSHYRHDAKNTGSLSNDVVNKLMRDKEGNIWIGTDGGGLDILNPANGLFTNYAYDPKNPSSLSDNDVTHIFEDSRSRLWISTFNGGLNLFDRTTHRFTRFQHDEKNAASLASNIVWKTFEDSHHRLWIGTRGGGLDQFDPVHKSFRHFKNDPHNSNSLTHNVVMVICEDTRGNLWIGTENGGISILDPEKEIFHTYRHDDMDNTSLGDNSIYSFYKDAQGTMWIGSYSGGIDVFNQAANKFIHYKHNSFPNSLSDNHVLAIFEDSQGVLWLGTDGGGLNQFDRKTGEFVHYKHQPGNAKSICGDYVLRITEDSQGDLWMGTWGGGITIFNRARNALTQFKNDPDDTTSISDNNIWGFAEDRERNMWVGTYGDGLNLYDRKTSSFRHFKHDATNSNSLSSDRIHLLFCDSKDQLWIGTFDKGLNLFDKQKNRFTRYQHDDKKNSISNNSINCLHEDKQGNIWIGTADGLNLLDRKTGHFSAWSTSDGLPNAMIFGILEDDKNNLWISTNKGISRFNPKTGVFKNFSVADGLQSNEFKAHSNFLSSSGAMYFGGSNGFNEFYPDSIKDNPFVPPLVFTNFQVFNKEVAISDDGAAGNTLKKDITETKEITISYKQSVISFGFASLNYTSVEKKQYAYRLVGFDKKWNNIDIRRTATYTNLDPGKYVFEVKGLNNDGSWSPAISSLQLTITPPFWMTWWFRLSVILIISGSIIAFYRIRMGIVSAQKKGLEEQVAILDKAVRQGKFEMASDVLHDIGNAIVGFGSYMTRVRRMLDQDKPENLRNLAGFFEGNQPAMATAIGEAKADAVVKMLNGIAETQLVNQDQIRKTITEQLNTISHIQEILSIQRQYMTSRDIQERTPVNLRSIVNDCLSMLFSSADQKGIAVLLDMPEDLPTIKGDRTKLMQVLLNLLKNSMEAIGMQDGEKTITIKLQQREDTLILSIRDSGAGFDETTAAQLFVRGFSNKPSGRGASLYSCREIMESHAGLITLTSEGPGKGSLATITFKI